MKPGGVLEACVLARHYFCNALTQKFVHYQVIDEDLLFPGHRWPKPKTNGKVPPVPRRRCESSMVPSSAGSDSHFTRAPDTRSADAKTSLHNTVHTDGGYELNNPEDLPSSSQGMFDIVDHSRLTRAWHEMLESQWISASVTSVLPFYLSVTFPSFRALPTLKIVGPASPSSFPSQQSLDPEPFRCLRHTTVKNDAGSPVTWLPQNNAPPHFIPSEAPLHLLRMVNIVTSCKEAIWGVYNKLYCGDPRPRRPNDVPGKTNVFTMREEFDQHWLKWEWSVFLPPLFALD